MNAKLPLTAAAILLSSINAGLAQPVITLVSQPADWVGASGGTVSLIVLASGTSPLSYQWRQDGVDLPGATNRVLTLRSVQPTNAGGYTVGITNLTGGATSRIAQLSVADGWVFTNAQGIQLPYRLFLPPKYDPGTRYPLVLFWHGSSRAGTDNVNQLADYGQYTFLTASNLAKWPCFFLAPQEPYSYQPTCAEVYNVLDCATNLLSYLETQFSLDPDRVYVTGLSSGGAITWEWPAHYADRVAAAVPLAGWWPCSSLKDFQRNLGVPVWNFHASDDGTVGISSSDTAVAALRGAGASPIYTRYGTGGHEIWQAAYGTPGLVDWVMAQRRGVAPTNEPLLMITNPTHGAAFSTGATNLNLAGTAAALGQVITKVTWQNMANNRTGTALGTNAWSVTGIPLVSNRTNLILVTATTTSWAPAYGGNTTFNRTLTVVQSPLRATLTWQSTNALLNWTGGGPPYRVQRATSLAAGDWSDLLPNAAPPVTLPLPPASKAGFYRIVGQ
jgi:poly(3-hydroxybutyrate) depolymerase